MLVAKATFLASRVTSLAGSGIDCFRPSSLVPFVGEGIGGGGGDPNCEVGLIW